MEAGWSARRVARQLSRSDSVAQDALDRPVVEKTATSTFGIAAPTHQYLRWEWCRARGNWTAAEWIQVVLNDESRFNLSSDDNRVRVRKHHGERLNPAFALQQHTTPTAGVMVWAAIAYNTRSRLVLSRGTITAQWYVHDILQPRIATHATAPRSHFQQDNARPQTARVL
ncbi:transposable element Tcb2 transposase [Trichonephila clavipes]|nr:transposable element Tcb2 transposase [Trichonephila clavipes]